MAAEYDASSEFHQALEKEIARLEQLSEPSLKYPFLADYFDILSYLPDSPVSKERSTEEYMNLLSNPNINLEHSGLMKAVILELIKKHPREELEKNIDTLLEKADITSDRGQHIIVVLLNIFDAYGLKPEKEKYFHLASELQCGINEQLQANIDAIKNTQIGGKFPNYTFSKMATKNKMKSLYDIKGKKKLIMFWSSQCPHCVSELPHLKDNYDKLKKNNIEVIALSLDIDKKQYQETIKDLPWINDTELNGWNSSFVEKYYVNGTPTFFYLNEDNVVIDSPMNVQTLTNSLNN